MAIYYELRCPDCGYHTYSAGGVGIMMLAMTRTMVCGDCRELREVLIGFRGERGPSGDAELDSGLEICPDCGSTDLTEWTFPGPCPKCGAELSKGDGEMCVD